MRQLDVLAIQRVSAADRARIEAVDPAVRLTDAGGWFDGEIRETWPAFTVNRYLQPDATGSRHARGTRRIAGERGSDPWRLAVSRGPARPCSAAALVSPAPGRREQPAAWRPVGQRRGGDDVARCRQHAGHGGIRHRRHPVLRQRPAPRGGGTHRAGIQSPRLSAAADRGQDPVRDRCRRHRPRRRPARRCVGHARDRHTAPPATRLRRCRPGFPRLAAPTTCGVSSAKAISSRSAASGRRKPPT